MKRLGKILNHLTCKAYLTVNADRLPKYNQHRVITDGHCVTRIIESPADEEQVKIASMYESTKQQCRAATDKSSLKGIKAR